MDTLVTIIVTVISVAAVVACGLIFIGAKGPDTSVYVGRQVPRRFLATIRALGLLHGDETIRYFYSDAFIDIKKGLYFVTDKRLVLYSTEWEQPESAIALDDIQSIDVEYSDEKLEDSMVFICTYGGEEVSFPVSNEHGLDKKFVKAIKDSAANPSPSGFHSP